MKSEQIKEEVQEEVVTEAETAPAADTLEAKVQQLEEQNAAQQDQYKRVLAEYDNFRKRSAKEKETIYADVTAQTVSEFLPVLDNLERAAAREDASQGAQLIYKQFCDVLSKLKVEPCAKVGDAFDPNLHNAVMHIEDETLGENVIAEVLLQGYTRNGRLVRPAMVKVAN
jgi:molecular chaperone GrpE